MRRENQISSSGSDNLTLPESYELEKAILGALILEPDNVSDVREIIGASAFYHPQNAKIYEAICRLDDQGIAPNLISVDREARRVGVPLYDIVLLTQAVGSAIGILSHARQLRELECLRRLVLLGTELSARASDGNHSADEVGGWITQQIEEIAAKTARVDDIAPLSSVVRVALDGLEQRQNARQSGECVGVPTGLSRLDALTGGWRGGQLIVLAGRPAMGKSAAMLHFARSAAASGVPVCIFSLEMPAEQLVGRLLI